MAKKRFRDFLRLNMPAKTATFLVVSLVDKTFNDHFKKCMGLPLTNGIAMCSHEGSRSLHVARLVEVGMKIGTKRATLDLPCPYSLADPQEQIVILKILAKRIDEFSTSEKKQRRSACLRMRDEVLAYAERNAMQVIAEAAR